MKDYITSKKNFVLHKQICLCNIKIFHLISKNHLERKVNEKTIKKTLLIYYRSTNGYFSSNASVYCSGRFCKAE